MKKSFNIEKFIGFNILVLGFVLFISNIGFLLGISINKLIFPLAFLASFLTIFFLNNKNIKEGVLIFIYSIILYFFANLVAIQFYDISYDGQAYHQQMIYELYNGWNPIRSVLNDKIPYHELINYYQKGIEIIFASFFKLTGNIESAKAINYILLILAFLGIFSLSKKITQILLLRLLTAYAIIFSTILTNQFFSFYIDISVHLCIIIFIITLINLFVNFNKINRLTFIVSSVLLISIKLSTGYIFLCIYGGYLVYNLINKKHLKQNFIDLLSIGVIFLIFNINPFITNIQQGKHLFHSFLGEEKIELLEFQKPPKIRGLNKYDQMYKSIFSEVDSRMNIQEYTSKMPFQLKSQEINSIAAEDIRLSGFGIFFSGILLIAILSLFYIIYKVTKEKKINNELKILSLLILTIICSIIISPELWWARLIPQFWLIPILIAIMLFTYKNESIKIIGVIILLFACLNSSIHFGAYIHYNKIASKEMRGFLKDLEGKKIILNQREFNTGFLRLQQNNISYKLGEIKEDDKDIFYMPYSHGLTRMKIDNE